MPTLPHSEPPSQQQATANSWLHQRLLTPMDKSGSVFCGVTAPFSGILMTQSFVCVLQESDSPVLCKFWRLYGGVKGDLLQEGLCHAQVCCTQSPCPCLHRRHSNTVLAQPLWDPWVLVSTKFGEHKVWALWASLVGMGFDSKRDFAPPTCYSEVWFFKNMKLLLLEAS